MQSQGFVLPFSAALRAQPKPGMYKWEAQMDFSGQPASEDLAVFRSCPSPWFTPVRSGMRETCGCVLLPPLRENTAFSWGVSPAGRWHKPDHISGNLPHCPAYLQQECFERMFNWMGKIRVQTDYASPVSPHEGKEPKCQSNTLY